MSELPRRKHSHVMRELIALDGLEVVDVGCGDGALVRFMARQGARVVGVECSEGQLERCRAAVPAAEERYLPGFGEDLPLPDESQDLVVYFNSLHHVPVAVQEQALEEARRVLRPQGRLYVMEPLAQGAYFELVKEVEDETLVRAKAYEAIHAVVARGRFREEQELAYSAPFKHASFADWKAGMLRVEPGRRAALEACEDELSRGFEALAEQREGAYWFSQPSRLNLLRAA